MTRCDFFIDLLANFTGQDKEVVRARMMHYRKVAEDNAYMDGQISAEEAKKYRDLIASNPSFFARFLVEGAIDARNKIKAN